jgi:hypothetical protein
MDVMYRETAYPGTRKRQQVDHRANERRAGEQNCDNVGEYLARPALPYFDAWGIVQLIPDRASQLLPEVQVFLYVVAHLVVDRQHLPGVLDQVHERARVLLQRVNLAEVALPHRVVPGPRPPALYLQRKAPDSALHSRNLVGSEMFDRIHSLSSFGVLLADSGDPLCQNIPVKRQGFIAYQWHEIAAYHG